MQRLLILFYPALKDGLMSKEEFSAKMAETQHDLLYGLESKVLDKVRNDPVIMEKMSLLAQHQTGKETLNVWMEGLILE